MFSLVQAAKRQRNSGEALPDVWAGLADYGTRFIRGQLALVAAGPGGGKSAFILNYCLKSGVPALYFSADSDVFTQLSRSIAIRGGVDMTQAGEIARSEDYDLLKRFVGDLPVRFDFNAQPSLEYIQLNVNAYKELFGVYPELIVIDNAMDVDPSGLGGGDQSESLDSLMGWLHGLARTTQSCVVVLHHVTGPFNDANKPIPLSGIKGQVGRVPELILTLHQLDGGGLGVSTVKNRGQQADPSGQSWVPLLFNGFYMSITDGSPSGGSDPFEYARYEGVM